MADEKNVTKKDPEKEIAPFASIDQLLQLLVIFGNTGVGFPVTLSVKGTIITGTIIPFTTYMERLATILRDPAFTRTDPAGFEKVMDNIAEGFEKIKVSWEQSAKDDPHMIHLDNVAIYNPTGGINAIKGGLWRGRLDSVDGFIFGGMNTD